MESRLCQIFTEAWPGRVEDLPADLEDRLVAAWRAARAAWPAIALEDTQFVRHVAERVPAQQPAAALDKLQVSDLYLACACAAQLPAALTAFDRLHLASVPGSLRKFDGSSASIDDVPQIVRTVVLIGNDGARPRIHDYKGRGPLGKWLKVVAQNIALDLLRRDGARERATTRAAPYIVPLRNDPELDYFKERHRDDIKAAFNDAVGTLSARQRVILKLHFVDRLSHERIATMYKVHQSTVTRWIEAARDAVAAEVVRLLSERLGVKPAEVKALFDLVRSQLDLSLTRIFGEAPDGDAG